MNETYSQEVKFCVRYLLNHGVNALNFNTVVNQLGSFDKKFDFVQVKKKDNFFDELAEKLRELWPPGEKEGKYPWRDSIPNLSRRLMILWAERFPDATKCSFTIDQCLAVARRYLAQFENDTKYMMTLKYFIMKQDPLIDKKGRKTYTNKSKFADMLESQKDFDIIEGEWDDVMNSQTLDEGELI